MTKLRSGITFDFSFRNAIKPTVGWKFLGFDYSQQELRILAGEAKELALIEAFTKGEDPHAQAASLLFNKSLTKVGPADLMLAVDEEGDGKGFTSPLLKKVGVTSEERAKGKSFNFSTIYGQGIQALAESIGTTKSEAQQLQDKYFAIYRNIKAYVDKQIKIGKETGEIYTKFGRRCTIWEYQSTNPAIYSKGDRMCVNLAIQGGAADYTKTAMVRANKTLQQAKLLDTCKLVMNVHDALYYEIPEDADIFTYIDLLTPAIQFTVPGWPEMEAEWSVGPSWGEMKKVNLVTREEPQFNKGGPVNVPSEGTKVILQAGDAILAFGEHSQAALSSQEPAEPPYTQTIKIADLGLNEPSQSLVLTLPAMPTAEQGQRLVNLIGKGRNKLTLNTPQGYVPFIDVAITSDMEEVVQMVIPGAKLEVES